MNETKRKELIEWLESMPWWEELPYAQLEAKLLAHQENEGDECPLCQLEGQVDWYKDANRKWQIKWEQLKAENEALREGLAMLSYDCYGVAYEYPDRRLVNTLLTGVQEVDALLKGEKK